MSVVNTRMAAVCVLWSLAGVAAAADRTVTVADDAALRAALRAAGPGTTIRIAPGRYQPGLHVAELRGEEGRPIVIEGAEARDPPRFVGGKTAWQFSDCAWLTLRNVAVQGQSINGLNLDDGGSVATPSHHIVLEDLRLSDIGPSGNFDGIKLSGVDDFTVRGCRVEGWGGQAIDMVGCHRGLVEDCEFVGKDGYSQATGPQTKGGSSQITIRRCHFQNAGTRAVNLGGSTGRDYFRPPGATYEAKDIVVEGCTFVDCTAPIAYVGVDGARVRYNTIQHPDTWVIRILQETRGPDIIACRNGLFERNLIVFRRSDLRTSVNVGSGTEPASFRFADNFWYCEDAPAASRPDLPVPEPGGVYGRNPNQAPAANYGAAAWPPPAATPPR